MALLWSDRDDDHARSSLRQTLSGLRKNLGEELAPALLFNDDMVSLDPEMVELAPRCNDNVLLEGLQINDPAFDEWVRDERLCQGDRVTEPSTVEPLTLPEKPSIAVVPFINKSEDSEQDFLADGIAEDIVTALSKIPRLFVVSSCSVAAYRGVSTEVERIGAEQGVHYVLEGSVRRSGNRLRISSKLTDCRSGVHIWAERYDREPTDLFLLQDEMTQEIVSALQVRLTDGEQAMLWKSGTKNLTAWEHVVEATALLGNHAKGDSDRALQLAEEAVRLDPDYASAHALIGWLYWQPAFNAWTEDPAACLDRAEDSAMRAYQIDPQNPATLSLLSMIHLSRRNFAEALDFSARAQERGQGNATCLALAGTVAMFADRPEESKRLLRSAMRHSPYYPAWYLTNLAHVYWICGELDTARQLAQKSLELDPGYFWTCVTLTVTESEREDVSSARAAANQLRQCDPDFSIDATLSVQPYANDETVERMKTALRFADLPE